MRPIKLTIKGINSYVSAQTVDFEQLSKSKLFGIFGDTGSGKTTILDAITLALYGTTDRDSLQNVINVNVKDAYIEFCFEMSEGDEANRYYIRRDYKVRPSGLKTEATLTDKNGKLMAEGSDNVNDEVLKIVGIGKKEFNKCIALPQGEFDKFLLDTPAGRKKTIAKLFELECYGATLNDKVRLRRDELKIKKLSLEDKLSVYDGLNESAVNDIVQKLEDSKMKRENLIATIGALEASKRDLLDDLKYKQKLFELDVNLTMLKGEKEYIDSLRSTIEFSEKYGEINKLLRGQKESEDNVEKLSSELIINRYTLQKSEENIKLKLSYFNEIKSSLTRANATMDLIKLEKDKKAFYDIKINELNNDIAQVKEELNKLQDNLNVSNDKLYELNRLDNEAQLKANKLSRAITKNEDAIERLMTLGDIQCRQDVVQFLTGLKNEISPENLAEVQKYAVYEEINYVLRQIENFEVQLRREIGQINESIAELKISDCDTVTLINTLKKSNVEYKNALTKINDSINALHTNITTIKSEIAGLTREIEQKKEYADKLRKELLQVKTHVLELTHLDEYDSVNKECIVLTQRLSDAQSTLDVLASDREHAIVDLEVNTTKLKNEKIRLSELKSRLGAYRIKNLDMTYLMQTNVLSGDDLKEAKEKVEKYDTNYNILSTRVAELKEKTKASMATTSMVANVDDKLNHAKAELNDIEVFINVNQYTIDVQRKNLVAVKAIQTELDDVTDKLNTVNKLATLISNGALIEFVSEEYMHLITNFANKYVYSISKGKYLLKYDGEFNVLDNFNGGIKRSVKTLSGGERFIISLSLALGISQSIAVNNNKNFSFFFIDEGFGSLSSTYLEKVLQAFNELIALDFTIGFISHVEKMQEFIDNKIFVTKESNDIGTVLSLRIS